MTTRFRLGSCTFDATESWVERDGKHTHLQPVVCKLLAYLVAHPQQLLRREALLDEVWEGVHVSDQALTQVLRKVRLALGDDTRKPRMLETVPRRGYRLVVPVVPLSADHAHRPLPRALDGFIGREETISQICRWIDQGERLITLTGPGGVGKSRVALETAHRIQGDHGRAEGSHFSVSWCELAAVRTQSTLVESIAQALGVPLVEGDPDHQLRDALKGLGPTVLCLDNLEQLVDLARPCLQEWMQAAPELAVLATSRTPLDLSGERRVPLAPLDSEASESDAVTLFFERAQRIQPDLAVTPGTTEAVLKVVRALDGLPLGIELAAARCALSSPEELAAEGSALLGRLSAPDRKSERHATLLATVLWSWSLLTEPERITLAQCLVFQRDFTPASAEAVIHPGKGHSVHLLLRALVHHSLLVRRTDPHGTTSLHLLQSVRNGLAEHLREAPEQTHLDGAYLRHAEHMATLGEASMQAELEGPNGPMVFRHMQRHRMDMKAAIMWSLANGRPDLAAHGWTALASLLSRANHKAILDWCRRLDEVKTPSRERLRVNLASAQALRTAGHLDQAESLIDQSHALAQSRHPEWLGWVHSLACLLHLDRGRPGQAADSLEDARTAGPPPDLPSMTARLQIYEGILRYRQGALDAAQACWETALETAQRNGWSHLAMIALGNRALLQVQVGALAAARDAAEEVLAHHRSMGDRREEGRLLGLLSDILHDLGDTREGDEKEAQAIRIHQQTGARRQEAISRTIRADRLLERGEVAETEVEVDRAMLLHQSVGNTRWSALSRCIQAVLQAKRGSHEQAQRSLDQARATLEEMDDPISLANVETYQAMVALEQGDPEGAQRALNRAAQQGRQSGLPSSSWLVQRISRLHAIASEELGQAPEQ